VRVSFLTFVVKVRFNIVIVFRYSDTHYIISHPFHFKGRGRGMGRSESNLITLWLYPPPTSQYLLWLYPPPTSQYLLWLYSPPAPLFEERGEIKYQ